MVEMKRFDGGGVLIDDRYSPILITFFFGEVSLDCAMWHANHHERLVQALAKKGLRAVTITDATYTPPPAAEVRKFWGDWTKKLTPEVKAATLMAATVLKSAVLRGILTALSWLNSDLASVQVFDSIDGAIQAGRLALQNDGQRNIPEVPRYQFPAGVQTFANEWLEPGSSRTPS